MMGDDMAIRSGGMYGNPESAYTIARPIVNSTGFGGSGMGAGLSWVAKGAKISMGLVGAGLQYNAEMSQITRDLETLRKEREYNLTNFKQRIADTFAMNKASFYASGLDFTGTALSVARENKRALTKDMRMMQYNYQAQEESLKEKESAARHNRIANIASSILGAF